MANERLAGWVFYLYLPGVAALLYGFAAPNTSWLATGGVLLALAFALYLYVMVATLVSAPIEDLVSAHVAAAFAYLTFAALLGVLLAFNLRYRVHGQEPGIDPRRARRASDSPDGSPPSPTASATS